MHLDIKPGAFGHPFQNNGACSGICIACGNSAPEHEYVALKNGKKVIISGRRLLLKA